ncbi:MAG: YIP1 family protein [Candidatus Hodarchaeales archaeon]
MGLNEYNSGKPRFCGNCGKELIEGATFCAYCGHPVPDLSKPSGLDQIKTESKGYTELTTVQPYRSQYHGNILRKEPPLPFAHHLRGVIASPKQEMPEIANRPNLQQPFLIVLIVGLISSLGVMILFSKITLNMTDNYFASLGIPPGAISEGEIESMMSMIPVITAISAPIGFIINWLINGVILWILHVILASRLDPKSRSFKKMLTIIGWSFLPNSIEGVLNIFYYLFFISPQTITVNSNADLQAMAAIMSNNLASMILMIISIVMFVYSIILIYFAIKPTESQGANPIAISIVYILISFILTNGVASSFL